MNEAQTTFHAASILAWVEVAKAANVPYIPAECIATIPMSDVCAWLDGQPYSKVGAEQMDLATRYIKPGRFWRFDLCASSDVKAAMARGEDLPGIIPLNFDDPRFLDIHYGVVNSATIVARPRVTPVRVNGYPIEFRVFHGGQATDGAVSFYYPQAGRFELTWWLQEKMAEARAYAHSMHRRRMELGLETWLPGAPGDVGSTIDFMLTELGGLMMVDAGPGWGFGADPCCFAGRAVEGEAWWLE